MAEKEGIVLVGTALVDEILPVIEPGQLYYMDAHKFVDDTELAPVEVQASVGGMALNVGVDLAKINGGYSVAVIGKVGEDARADLIRQTLRENKIDDANLIVDPGHPTSGTQVLYIRMPDGKIERFFQHWLGAMGSVDLDDIDVSRLANFKIAMFGYGLLLPKLDLHDDEFGTRLGRVLAATQKLGVKTAIDFVSPNTENEFKFHRYRDSLRYVDYISINDDQACSLAQTSDPAQACQALVEDFSAKTAVVHCGARGPNFAYSMTTGLLTQDNFYVSEHDNKGNAGAGDAFAAGFLHGCHREWPLADSLRFAAAAAAVSLGDPSCTGAMQPEAAILNFMEN